MRATCRHTRHGSVPREAGLFVLGCRCVQMARFFSIQKQSRRISILENRTIDDHNTLASGLHNEALRTYRAGYEVSALTPSVTPAAPRKTNKHGGPAPHVAPPSPNSRNCAPRCDLSEISATTFSIFFGNLLQDGVTRTDTIHHCFPRHSRTSDRSPVTGGEVAWLGRLGVARYSSVKKVRGWQAVQRRNYLLLRWPIGGPPVLPFYCASSAAVLREARSTLHRGLD